MQELLASRKRHEPPLFLKNLRVYVNIFNINIYNVNIETLITPPVISGRDREFFLSDPIHILRSDLTVPYIF
jgi:hypothetical protein